jgi:hypothetical protein
MENIGHKKGNQSSSKMKEHQEASKERKKKWKAREDKKRTTIVHQCKDPNNHLTIAILVATRRKSSKSYIQS